MFSIFKKKPVKVTDLCWLGLDMHSHLLPGIDDGAPDVAQTVALITKLNALGLSKFFCTPHIFKELYPNTSDSIRQALEAAKDALKAAKINVEIEAAAEYMIDENFESEDEHICLPKKYILIEMSYLNESPNVEQIIFDLQIKGYIVILAHPERYTFYHKNYQRLHRLKDMGCLFQLNLLSVIGYYGPQVKQAADYLLRLKLYDLAGTDLHHERHMSALEKSVKKGELYDLIGNYNFRNVEIFG
ncbi:tyrosine-protein phosphatase [Pedobacter psychrodurus]|uniref:tyrosine-protein phosphatase n=1 Tax=Pedobacter psychrodurus TaxID=2530456 RepID=UPI00292CC78E|nr:CpsB/CapC family capsule biosynthesis tyrosine phosphatase [Pedobacter psychrodurus]